MRYSGVEHTLHNYILEMFRIYVYIIAIFSFATPTFCCYLPETVEFRDFCDSLNGYLVSRKQWGAKEPLGPIECMRQPARYVIIHHTYSRSCNDTTSCYDSMRKIQKDHMKDDKWPDIGYHFAIGGDGKGYAGRSCCRIGGHTKNHNRISIGIAFIGDFSKEPPRSEALDLLPNIVYCGVRMGYIHPNFIVIGHRDAICSTCPGDALYNEIKKWPRFPSTVPLPSYTCDNAINPSSSAKLANMTTTATTDTKSSETTISTKAATTAVTEVTTAATTKVTTAATTKSNTAATTEITNSKFSSPILYYYVLMSGKPISEDILKMLSIN